jgi:pSer/pThr/pTyr-binding forkhead associated (FHA) protein
MDTLVVDPPQLTIGGRLLVGRDPAANLVVDDPAVSRRHVELRRQPDGWLAVDLGSTNGTYVNGFRVGHAHLRPGDVLGIGDTRLRVR